MNVLIGGEPAGSIEVVRDDVLTCTMPGSESSPPHHSTGAVDVPS